MDARVGLAHQIHVNSVNPGGVSTGIGKKFMDEHPEAYITLDTSRYPMGRSVTPEEVSNAVMYLLRDKSDMINGTFLHLDGSKNCTRFPQILYYQLTAGLPSAGSGCPLKFIDHTAACYHYGFQASQSEPNRNL